MNLTQMTIISTTVGKNPLEEMEYPSQSTRESEMQYLGAISKMTEGKLFNITVIQVCAPTSNAEEAEVEWFCEDLQDLLELTPKKDVLFIIGDWNAKVGSQEIPGVIGKFGLRVQNNEGQRLTVLPRGCTGHSKHPFPTTQEKTLQMDITRWSKLKSDWLYSLQPKMENSIQSTKTRPGADSDHEFFIAKFRLKLKKVGKINYSGMTLIKSLMIIQWKWEIDLRA